MSAIDKVTFDNALTKLSKFRDSKDKKSKMIVLKKSGSSYVIDLKEKPAFIQRICNLFYKHHSKRLKTVVDHTVSFLENNETFLCSHDNLEKLQNFQSRLLTVSGIHKKASASIQRLKDLIKKVELVIEKMDAETIELSKQKADDIIKAANQRIDTQNKLLQLDKATHENKMQQLQNEIDAIRIDDLIDKGKEDNHKKRLEHKKYIIEFPEFTKYQALLTDTTTHDMIFNCSDHKIVTCHSLLFSNFLKKYGHSLERDANGKITFALNELDSEKMQRLIMWCYGIKSSATLNLKEFIDLTLNAEYLELSPLVKILHETIIEDFKLDPALSYHAFEIFAEKHQKPFTKISSLLLNHLLKTIQSLEAPKLLSKNEIRKIYALLDNRCTSIAKDWKKKGWV